MVMATKPFLSCNRCTTTTTQQPNTSPRLFNEITGVLADNDAAHCAPPQRRHAGTSYFSGMWVNVQVELLMKVVGAWNRIRSHGCGCSVVFAFLVDLLSIARASSVLTVSRTHPVINPNLVLKGKD